ncbi:MAG: hypothetical protein ACFFG0_10185 [Candidatus Thorarchaeota archaeon]
MSDIFNGSVDKNPNEDLCVVYVLYFDEKKGHIPLLMYPDDRLRNDKRYMRPVNYHPVWFLETAELDHIDLEYKGYTFFGKKFLVKSKRQKRRAGLEVETPETIVIIVSLPIELDIFGDGLIRKLTDELRSKFEDQFFEVIESEIASEIVIKTPKVQERITKGNKIKVFMRELIDNTTKNYFYNVIQKKAESPSFKTQKAISYFALKGFDSAPYSNLKGEDVFSIIELLDPTKQANEDISTTLPVSITNINFIENSQEIEFTVQNNTDKELQNITITITHVKEFFEKEVMNEKVDFWFPKEELLFVSPIVPYIDEYLFSVNQRVKGSNNLKILSQRIDINLIEKI